MGGSFLLVLPVNTAKNAAYYENVGVGKEKLVCVYACGRIWASGRASASPRINNVRKLSEKCVYCLTEEGKNGMIVLWQILTKSMRKSQKI